MPNFNQKWVFPIVQFLVLFLTGVIWFFTESSALRSAVFGALLLVQIWQSYRLVKQQENKFLVATNILFDFLMLLMLIAYVMISLGMTTIAVVTLGGFFFVLFIALFLGSIILVVLPVESNTLLPYRIIIAYGLTAITAIGLFSLIYAFNADMETGSVLDSQGKQVSGPELFYYSAGVFYSTAIVEGSPYDSARFWSLVELILSATIHVIIIGAAISSKPEA